MKHLLASFIIFSFLFPFIANAAPFPVALGGTGWSNIAATYLLIGNGTSPLATSSNLFWTNASSRLSFTNGSSTNQTTSGVLWLTNLGTAAGAFLAVDPNGKVIATTTPGGSGTVTSITAGNGLDGGTILTSGTLSLKSYIATSTADTASQVLFFSSTNGNPATVAGNSGFTFATTGSLLTATNASTTAFSASVAFLTGATASTLLALNQNKQLISTTSIGVNLLTGVLPIANGGTNASSFGTSNGIVAYNGSALVNFANYTLTSSLLSVTNASTTALTVSNNNLTGFAPIVVYIASSTWGAGTTTIQILLPNRPVKFTSVRCQTSAGTLNFQLGKGSASTTMLQASTTNNQNVYSSNNTFVAGDKVGLDVGTAASSPTWWNCSFEYTQNSS